MNNAATDTASSPGMEMAFTMQRIADRAVICDIESEGVAEGPRHLRCYDIRPMLDAREHSHEVVDMFSEALAYAIARGLVLMDEARPGFVRIVAHGD